MLCFFGPPPSCWTCEIYLKDMFSFSVSSLSVRIKRNELGEINTNRNSSVEISAKTNSRNSRSSKHSSSRSQYAGKVKCYTLKSVQPSPNSAGSRLMLGLKDPKVDSYCEYEQRSIATKLKRPRVDAHEKDNRGIARSRPRSTECQSNIAVQDRDFMSDTCGLMMPSNDFRTNENSVMVPQSQDFKSEKASDQMREKENSVTLYSSEPNGENSKAFMESIGSWINDLFTVPNKKLFNAPKPEKEEVQKSLVLEDTEYLKSISVIKEQFRKKLKSETSVHLSCADKPFEFHFDKVLENTRKPKKRVRSMPSTKYSDCLEELTSLNPCPTLDQIVSEKTPSGNKLTPTGAGLYIRTNSKETAPQSGNNNLILSSNLVKKKRKISHKSRSEMSKLEEYVLPSPAELSKRILLNINDQEKCLQFYKNPHLAVQEAQHYAARKTKPCQTNTRCYTTNANGTDSAENSRSKTFMTTNRHSHFFTGDVPEVKAEEDVLPNKSPLVDFKKPSFRKAPVKNISELSKDTLSLAKLKAAKSLIHPQMESIRSESKATSDELVKYLMKKIKVSGRPQSAKKKGSNVPQVLVSPKTRFMQSATNTLVLNAMAKKENEIPGLGKPRTLTDKLMKTNLPSKELIVKYPEGNIRFDVSRALNYSKFNKSTYIMDEDKPEDDSIMLGKSYYKNTRRPYEDLLKKDSKKNSDKISKRQEVKQMLSKIDMKLVLNSPKIKPTEYKKKVVKNMLDNLDVEENKESQNPRFMRQHELFKNNTKTVQPTIDPVPEPSEKQSSNLPSPNSLSTELALVNTDLQLTLANLEEKNMMVTEQPEETSSNRTPEENNKITDLLCIEENTSPTKAERPPVKHSLYREKLHKNKSQNFLKENDGKNLLTPLPEYYSSEIKSQTEASKSCEPGLCPPDLRPMKSIDTLLFNRRYSTNTLTKASGKRKSVLVSNHHSRKGTMSLTNLGKDSDSSEKKEAKEKQKAKIPKIKEAQEKDMEACAFEGIKKKPGPNCEKEETSKP